MRDSITVVNYYDIRERYMNFAETSYVRYRYNP